MPISKELQDRLFTPIGALGFSPRLESALRSQIQANFLIQLLPYTRKDFMVMPGISTKLTDDVDQAIEAHGFQMGVLAFYKYEIQNAVTYPATAEKLRRQLLAAVDAKELAPFWAAMAKAAEHVPADAESVSLEEKLMTPVRMLTFSHVAQRAFELDRIYFVAQVLAHDVSNIFKLNNVGRKVAVGIRDTLVNQDLVPGILAPFYEKLMTEPAGIGRSSPDIVRQIIRANDMVGYLKTADTAKAKENWTIDKPKQTNPRLSEWFEAIAREEGKDHLSHAFLFAVATDPETVKKAKDAVRDVLNQAIRDKLDRDGGPS